MFETYRYLVERVLKSQKYRSFSELLNALFEQHSFHMEQERTKSKSPKKKRALRRGATTVLAKKQSEELIDDFEPVGANTTKAAKDKGLATPEKAS